MIVSMTDRSNVDFETPLVNAIRHYLLQEPNERISEDENLCQVCHWLAPLLDRRLKANGGWGRYKSVDAIVPCTATRISTVHLEFEGLVIWLGDDPRKEWIDPLSASINILDHP